MTTRHTRERHARSLLDLVKRSALQQGAIEQSLRGLRQQMYLRSHHVKFTMLAREMAGAREEEIDRNATRFDPFARSAGPIPYIEITRSAREPRRVCAPPRNLRVRLKMAKALIEAQFEPHSTVYAWRGRGRDRFIVALRQALATFDQPWVLLADVRNCFPSINIDAIYNLGVLPEEFVAAAIDTRNMTFQKKDRRPEGVGSDAHRRSQSNAHPIVRCSERPGLSGLMQGSAASDALLAMLLNDYHSHVPRGVLPFLIHDNIVVVCASQQACDEVENTLGCYFSSHPAGPLTLGIDYAGPAAEGFETMGYSVRCIPGEGWGIGFTSKNLLGAVRRFVEIEQSQGERNDAFAALSELMRGAGAVGDETVALLVDFLDVGLA